MADVMMNGVNGGSAMNIEAPARGRHGGGVKRAADDSNLTDFDRFNKRLRALSIRNNDNRDRAEKDAKPQYHKRVPSKPGVLATGFKRRDAAAGAAGMNDSMDVDATKDRIYIGDLDAELGNTSSDSEAEDRLIFLPDIEARFSRLPAQVLSQPQASMAGPQELVLYSDPRSLSVEEEGQDSVRKAVVEARQRARERAAEEARARQEDMERSYGCGVGSAGDGGGGWGQGMNGMGGFGAVPVETAHGYGDVGYISPLRLVGQSIEMRPADEDPDAMDLG